VENQDEKSSVQTMEDKASKRQLKAWQRSNQAPRYKQFFVIVMMMMMMMMMMEKAVLRQLTHALTCTASQCLPDHAICRAGAAETWSAPVSHSSAANKSCKILGTIQKDARTLGKRILKCPVICKSFATTLTTIVATTETTATIVCRKVIPPAWMWPPLIARPCQCA
jgi:hypothetical protein